jgi:hypothetical protein
MAPIRCPFVLGALLLGIAAPARSEITKIPSAYNSTLPCAIRLVGCTGGAADPAGQFQVVVHDLANNPLEYALVVVDFTQCCADVRLASTQLAPGMILDAATHTVRSFTDQTGTATFCIMGAGRGGSGDPGAVGAQIYADGVPLTTGYPYPPVSVAAFDLDGAAGVSAAGVGGSDLSLWLSDLFAGYRARSDYDLPEAGCTPGLNGADLSRLLSVYFAARSCGNATAVACP